MVFASIPCSCPDERNRRRTVLHSVFYLNQDGGELPKAQCCLMCVTAEPCADPVVTEFSHATTGLTVADGLRSRSPAVARAPLAITVSLIAGITLAPDR